MPSIDFASLEVGQILPVLDWTVDGEQIIRYCGAADDYGPPHRDHQFMVAAGYPGVIAHGWLTCAIMCRVATGWPPLAGAVFRQVSVKYLKPNFPGPARYHGRIAAVEQNRCVIELWGENAQGQRMAEGSITAQNAQDQSETGL